MKRNQIGRKGAPYAYYIHLDKFVEFKGGGSANYVVVTNKQAALRNFYKNPKYGQIDVRGKCIKQPFCWKYWQRGKIITQKELI